MKREVFQFAEIKKNYKRKLPYNKIRRQNWPLSRVSQTQHDKPPVFNIRACKCLNGYWKVGINYISDQIHVAERPK